MRAKEFLQQYRNADEAINAKLEQIARLRSLAEKTTQTLTSDVVRTSPENKLERIVTKIADMENEVDAEVDRLQDIKKQVENVIAVVPDGALRTLLIERYIKEKTWKDVANTLGRTLQMTKIKLHAQALKVLESSTNINI